MTSKAPDVPKAGIHCTDGIEGDVHLGGEADTVVVEPHDGRVPSAGASGDPNHWIVGIVDVQGERPIVDGTCARIERVDCEEPKLDEGLGRKYNPRYLAYCSPVIKPAPWEKASHSSLSSKTSCISGSTSEPRGSVSSPSYIAGASVSRVGHGAASFDCFIFFN